MFKAVAVCAQERMVNVEELESRVDQNRVASRGGQTVCNHFRTFAQIHPAINEDIWRRTLSDRWLWLKALHLPRCHDVLSEVPHTAET
jgi:hypothetical protein